MGTFWLISYIFLWALVLLLGFLLLGTLRALGLLRWRLEQLEVTTPRRMGRSGLKAGAKAPDFTLPSVTGAQVALREWAGRNLLLVFLQADGCKPCRDIVPALNLLYQQGEYQVLAVANGEPETVRHWAAEAGARFPVLVQERWNVSRRYEVFATPFAFLINGQGVIVSRGIIGKKEYLAFLLAGAAETAAEDQAGAEPVGTAEEGESRPVSVSNPGDPS